MQTLLIAGKLNNQSPGEETDDVFQITDKSPPERLQ